MAYVCNEECWYCRPKNGTTGCPYFGERLLEVRWVSLNRIRDKSRGCRKFTKGTLDIILGLKK